MTLKANRNFLVSSLFQVQSQVHSPACWEWRSKQLPFLLLAWETKMTPVKKCTSAWHHCQQRALRQPMFIPSLVSRRDDAMILWLIVYQGELEDMRCLPREWFGEVFPRGRDPAGFGTRMSPTACAPSQSRLQDGWQGCWVPALASSLCLWRPKSFGNQQCPQDPRHTGWGNKDMLQCYHLHCVLHCNSQTSGAASSNCNHFSSLNFGFQYLKQASLGLAASVVPFGVGWGTPLSWPWRAARAQAPGWKDTHLGKALFCLIFPLLLSV